MRISCQGDESASSGNPAAALQQRRCRISISRRTGGIEDCGQHDGRSCDGGCRSAVARTGDCHPVCRALDAEAAVDRGRRRGRRPRHRHGLRVAVVHAGRSRARCPAAAPDAGLRHVPRMDDLVLVEQAVPGEGRRTPDGGDPPDHQRLARQRRCDPGGRLRRSVQGPVTAVDPVRARVRAAADGDRADDRPAHLRQDAPCRRHLPAGRHRRHRCRRRRPAPRRPALARSRLPRRRVRRRRRHRDARRRHRPRRHRRDRSGARRHRRDRRADLAVVGRVGGRQPAHP